MTKLSYLLSKPELSAEGMHKLVGVLLRGKLMRIPRGTPTPAIDMNFQVIGNTLGHIIRLTSPTHNGFVQLAAEQEQKTAHRCSGMRRKNL
jgi:hypothetical protein